MPPPKPESDSPEASSCDVRWNDVVRFVRQLSHDLRNHLNAVELQAAFLAELATDDELKSEVKKLRQMISDIGSSLQKVTSRLSPTKPNAMSYGVNEFTEDLRAKLTADYPQQSSAIEWDVSADEANIEIDAQQLQQALFELFSNAFENKSADGVLRVTVRIEGRKAVFSLHELKQTFGLATENWGTEPLRHVNRGHYGLGLYRARRIIVDHGGELLARYDSAASELTTTVTLPLSQPQS